MRVLGAAPLLVLAVLFCDSCASPGPPKPPSLHLPQVVKDLSAERIGDHVQLQWTTPSRTTDEMEIEGPMTAELCRATNTTPAAPTTKVTSCAPVRRLAVTPGESEVVDALPAALQAEPVELLSYRIQIFNATGHSAGESAIAYAAAGQAPEKIAPLRAAASERGAVLEWPQTTLSKDASEHLIDLDRVDLSAPPRKEKKPRDPGSPAVGRKKPAPQKKPGQQARSEVHLRAADAVTGPNSGVAGTVDSTAAMGTTYVYSARRIRTVAVGSRKLEIQSEPSAQVTLAMQDTFPPKIPSGLAAISGNTAAGSGAEGVRPPTSPYVDLSWEPNAEADLAGYRVYRQLARPDGSPQGPPIRLTTLPIAVPAYRDMAVRTAQGYIYSVTAVDAAGNESAPSAKALELVEPPN